MGAVGGGRPILGELSVLLDSFKPSKSTSSDARDTAGRTLPKYLLRPTRVRRKGLAGGRFFRRGRAGEVWIQNLSSRWRADASAFIANDSVHFDFREHARAGAVLWCCENGQTLRSGDRVGPLSHIKPSIARMPSVGAGGGGQAPQPEEGARQLAGLMLAGDSTTLFMRAGEGSSKIARAIQ
jgi:hypothetical protein